MASGSGGGKGLLVLLLLVIAGSAGGYNYHRNLQVERQEQGPRTLQKYSDAELVTLAAAYQSEIDQFMEIVTTASSKPVVVRGAARMQGRVREFERIQQGGEQLRALRGQLIDREGKLAQIEKEQAIRASHANGLALHMKRLLTINAG